LKRICAERRFNLIGEMVICLQDFRVSGEALNKDSTLKAPLRKGRFVASYVCKDVVRSKC